MPYLSFLFICTVWGASFILMKKAVLVFSPVSVGAWRVAGGAVVLGLVWLWRGRGWSLKKADLFPFFILVLLGFVWPFSLQPHLVSKHGSAFIGMTVSLVPLLTILVSIPMLGIHPTRRQVIGVTGALVCMGALMRDGLDREVPLLDLALAFTVPLVYATTNAYVRRSLGHVPSLSLTFYMLALATSLMFPLAACWPSPVEPSRADWSTAVLSLAMLGIIGTGISQFLFNKLVQEQGPLFAGMVTNLVPLGALLWGWIDGERVTLLQFIALIGILSMVLLVQYGAAVPRQQR